MKRIIIVYLLLFTSFFAFDKPYRGAEYRTKSAFLYGKFEVRMKSAGYSGMLCSFFTFHDPDPFDINKWNEIDIEILGRYNNEVQFNVITPGIVNHVKRDTVWFNPHNDFHVYSVEWTPFYVSWSVDGFEVFRETEEHIGTLIYPQKLMMNIWQSTNKDWTGVFYENSLPIYAYYDWVKYYSYTPGKNDNFTLEWTDNFDYFDQSRWEKASHTFSDNNTQFIPDNAVLKDGYLILCLTNKYNLGFDNRKITSVDTDPPYIIYAKNYLSKINVQFSEPINRDISTSNFIIPGVNIDSLQISEDNKMVVLFPDSITNTKKYILIPSSIKDTCGNIIKTQRFDIVNGVVPPCTINCGVDDTVWNNGVEYGYAGGNVNYCFDKEINNTEKDSLFQSYINGIGFYSVNLENGEYDVTLFFSENEFNQKSKRIFDVFCENEKIIENLDIYERAGSFSALEVKFSTRVLDRRLDLYFSPVIGNPLLCGIKIENKNSTSIKEHQGKTKNIKVYPNPNNGILYCESEDFLNRIDIYNVVGEKIISKQVDNNKAILNLTEFSNGIYFLRVISSDFDIIKKIIILK